MPPLRTRRGRLARGSRARVPGVRRARGLRRAHRRRHRVFRSDRGGPARPPRDGLHRFAGLDPQRGCCAVLHRGDPAADSARGARCDPHGGRPEPVARADRAGSTAAWRHRNRPRGRCTSVHGACRPVRRAAAHRRRHATQDLRGHGDGITGHIHARRCGGPPGRGRPGHRAR